MLKIKMAIGIHTILIADTILIAHIFKRPLTVCTYRTCKVHVSDVWLIMLVSSGVTEATGLTSATLLLYSTMNKTVM